MNVEQTRLPLQARTLTGCIDLGVRYFGSQLPSMLAIWLLVSVPATILIYVLAAGYEADLRVALALLYIMTIPLGGLLIALVGPGLKGQALSLRDLPGRLSIRGMWAFLLLIVARTIAAIGPALVLFSEDESLIAIGALISLVSLLLLTRSGFLLETRALDLSSEKSFEHSSSTLIRRQLSSLLMRGIGIFGFCLALQLVLLLSLEMVLQLVFQVSLFWELLANVDFSILDIGGYMGTIWEILIRDPALLAAHVAIGLFVYQLGRLAWFFCYIDARVRVDCWDVELKLIQESRRLQGLT